MITLYEVAQGYADEWRLFMQTLTGRLEFEKGADFCENDEICSEIATGRTFLKSIIRTIEIKDGKPGFLLHSPYVFLQNLDHRQGWSGRQDLNLRHLGPKPSALPG